MANDHLTGMLANNRQLVMPVQTGIQSPSTGMPAKLVLESGKRRASIQNTPTVMPAQAGIHISRTEQWIPAYAGMTEGGRTHTFDAASMHKAGIQGTHSAMPAKLVPVSSKRGEDSQEFSLTVMPAKAGIHSSRTEHWIPAYAGMTEGRRIHAFDAARLHAESEFEKYRRIQEAEYESDFDRLVSQVTRAADAEDLAALEQAERQVEGKGRGKKK